MALTEDSISLALDAIKKNGFYDLEDSAAGERVWDMEQRDFPWHEPYGLDFMKYVVWNPVSERQPCVREVSNSNQRIRLILKTTLGSCVLAHSYHYTARPGRYFRFIPSSKSAIGVFLFPKGSEISFFRISDTKDVRTFGAAHQPFYEAGGDALKKHTSENYKFPNGGM